MVLAGVTVLLTTNRFNDSIGSLARACLGNPAASCPAFFVVAIAAAPRLHRIWTAAIALVLVEAFELTHGCGVMTNVRDPLHYLANGLGVALASCVDFTAFNLYFVFRGKVLFVGKLRFPYSTCSISSLTATFKKLLCVEVKMEHPQVLGSPEEANGSACGMGTNMIGCFTG